MSHMTNRFFYTTECKTTEAQIWTRSVNSHINHVWPTSVVYGPDKRPMSLQEWPTCYSLFFFSLQSCKSSVVTPFEASISEQVLGVTVLCFEHKRLHACRHASQHLASIKEPATMTTLTAKDKAAVRAFWDKISGHVETIGKSSLSRLITVYPQSKTYFSHWKDGVDPVNFKLLSQNILVVMAIMFPADFTPEVHVAMDKFLAALALALSEKYR
ncbi:uncharacterized protein LOC112488437 [Cynoglossus semilaevis]|uniref:uncharacterized protein LOC112488437 n=1 Tax=Cynoglossus semilaevis TaxID=244447 RepID=UPI000496A5F8|nr:uncharacterized protein LOC112488437 [Cynoglossus semilaevis]